LYAADLAGYVYALNPDDLTQIWGTKAASRGIRPAPLVTDEFVVAASRDGKVYWLARETGEVVFSKEVEGRPEILSDLLLLEPTAASEDAEGEDGENAETTPELKIDEPMVLVATLNNSHLVVAMPLDYTSTYPGWVYAR
jgi:outer membrane protein assembly factor BamB